MGYAYGYLLAEEIKDCYYALLYSLLGSDLESKLLIEVLGQALDWQWRNYLVNSYEYKHSNRTHTCINIVNRAAR